MVWYDVNDDLKSLFWVVENQWLGCMASYKWHSVGVMAMVVLCGIFHIRILCVYTAYGLTKGGCKTAMNNINECKIMSPVIHHVLQTQFKEVLSVRLQEINMSFFQASIPSLKKKKVQGSSLCVYFLCEDKTFSSKAFFRILWRQTPLYRDP